MAVITFRLRPGRDEDIEQALAEAPVELDRSDLIRAALRAFLGITKANVPVGAEKRASGPPSPYLAADNDEAPLAKIEKADADIDADLNGLLGGF